MPNVSFDDSRHVREARTRPDPWSRRGITESEYDSLLADKKHLRQLETLADVKSILPGLVRLKQFKLAEWLVWQFKLMVSMKDAENYDLSNGIRAAKLFIAGEQRQAAQILAGIIGLAPEESHSSSKAPKSSPVTSGVEYHGQRSIEISQAFNKLLMDSIGKKYLG